MIYNIDVDDILDKDNKILNICKDELSPVLCITQDDMCIL